MERTLTVSQAARELGCSEKWLRKAEAEGKTPKARRNLNGWRLYSDENIDKIKKILIPA